MTWGQNLPDVSFASDHFKIVVWNKEVVLFESLQGHRVMADGFRLKRMRRK